MLLIGMHRLLKPSSLHTGSEIFLSFWRMNATCIGRIMYSQMLSTCLQEGGKLPNLGKAVTDNEVSQDMLAELEEQQQ